MTPTPNTDGELRKKTPTNDIGYPQYERTLENFYLWCSGGDLRDKLREFAIRYQDPEGEIFLDQINDAIIGLFASLHPQNQDQGTDLAASGSVATPDVSNPPISAEQEKIDG